MRNYDFHELLSPEEFQKFATSILRIRENKVIKNNAMIKDGGIDFYFLNEDVIGQVKNYQNKSGKVVSSLKKEIERVKRLKPKRYIIVTSAVIDKNKRELLMSMFDGFLDNEDIIDKNDLNELLEKDQYHKLEIEYLKLLVPNSFVLSHYLDKIENNKIYTRTQIELNKMNTDKHIFSINDIFSKALEKILSDRAIIISGEVGIGKSILGRMISSYLLNTCLDAEFFSVDSLNELFQVYNEDRCQIYFFDDFWGDTKYNFKITDKEKESLLYFINLIKKNNNKWLIITSREYIFKDGIHGNKKIENKYPLYKFTINLKELTMTAKFNILYKHLCNTDLSWNHLNVILKNWQVIIKNDNYNPRYIEIFLSNYNEKARMGEYDFLMCLLDYLDKPFDFWKDTLNKQPFIVKILFMIISLNDREITIKELNKRYVSIINKSDLLEKNFYEFKDLIKRMDDDFTISYIDGNDLIIKFRNPSYKDFILEYLKNNMGSYISCLFGENLKIEEAINLWKILNTDFKLYNDLNEVNMLDKFICNKIFLVDDNVKTKYLLELAESTDFGNNTKIEEYIIKFMIDCIVNIENVIWNSNICFGDVFLILEELCNKYDFSKYIYDLLYDIVFSTSDLYYFEEIVVLKKLYPDIFKEFYKGFGVDVRDGLYCSIINEAEYYCSEASEVDGLYMLKEEEIPRIYKNLGIKIPKKLIKEIDNMISSIDDSIDIEKDFNNALNGEKRLDNSKSEEDIDLVNICIENMVGSSEYVYFDDEIKKMHLDKGIKRRVKKINNNIMLEDLLYYKSSLNLVCGFLEHGEFLVNSIGFLDALEKWMKNENNLTEEEFFQLCYVAFLMVQKKKLIFKRDDFMNLEILNVNDVDLNKILDSSFFVKRGDWYHFVHPIIHIHLVLSVLKNVSMLSLVKMTTIVYFLIDVVDDWNDLDFCGDYILTVYRIAKEMFPSEWNSEFRMPTYKNFIDSINKENDIEIAKSILRKFDFHFQYSYSCGTSWSYKENILFNFLILDFDFNMADLFIIDFTPSEEMNDYLIKLSENNDVLEINKAIKTRKFVNLLNNCGIIKELNLLYIKILKSLEK